MKNLKKLKKELKEIQQKPPRMGVHPTKVIPDKTKYSRKHKHKDKQDASKLPSRKREFLKE